jgi:HEAT repeat protein
MWAYPEIEDELARRGSAAVPAILAELRRLSGPPAEGAPPSAIPPLLRMLGRIGGAEANAELHRWAEGNSRPVILAAAACALAAQGDRRAVPLIARHLKADGGEWPSLYPDMLKALGGMKAAEQTGAIRDVLATRGLGSAPLLLQSGIEALAAIGTDEAWAAISELSADKEPSRQCDVLTALQTVPGPRTVALAAKALDDPDARVREAAYWAIYRVQPKLLEGMPNGWSEENGRKLREALRRQENPKP